MLIFHSGYSKSRSRFDHRTSKIQVTLYPSTQFAADCPMSIDGNRGQKSAHEHRYRHITCAPAMCIPGVDKSLARPGRKKSSEACQGRARFQQHRDAGCHQLLFPARQGAEGNSRHSDINVSLFPSWSG